MKTTSTRALEASSLAFPSVLRPVSQQRKSNDLKRFTFFDCVCEACCSVRYDRRPVFAVPRHQCIRCSVTLPCQNDVKDKPLPYLLQVTAQKVSLPLLASALDSSHALEPDTEVEVGKVVDLDISDLRLGRWVPGSSLLWPSLNNMICRSVLLNCRCGPVSSS